MNFQRYPFDKQKCPLEFSSSAHSNEQVILAWADHEKQDVHNSFHMTEFELNKFEYKDNQAIDFKNEIFSKISIEFHLERRWGLYLLDTYFPSALFVCISWLSFWVQISIAPARITLGVTTMLTLVTGSRIQKENLPKISYINNMDIWIVACVCKYKIPFQIQIQFQNSKTKFFFIFSLHFSFSS